MALHAVSFALQTNAVLSSRDRPSVVKPQLFRFFRQSRTSGYRRKVKSGRTDIQNASAVSSPTVPATPVASQLLEVGTVLTTHGIKGELKVEALTDFPEIRLTVAGKRCVGHHAVS